MTMLAFNGALNRRNAALGLAMPHRRLPAGKRLLLPLVPLPLQRGAEAHRNGLESERRLAARGTRLSAA